MIINIFFIIHILVILFVILGPFLLPDKNLIIWFVFVFLMSLQLVYMKKCSLTEIEKRSYLSNDTLFGNDEFILTNLKRLNINMTRENSDLICIIIVYALVLYSFKRLDLYNYGVLLILIIIVLNLMYYKQITPKL